jgi:hypothetical protein
LSVSAALWGLTGWAVVFAPERRCACGRLAHCRDTQRSVPGVWARAGNDLEMSVRSCGGRVRRGQSLGLLFLTGCSGPRARIGGADLAAILVVFAAFVAL